ncbi:MAG: hypothetical protein ACO2ZM_02590, partial [Francisellaceae bacterium]
KPLWLLTSKISTYQLGYKSSDIVSSQNISDYAEYIDDTTHYIALGSFGGGLSFSSDGGESWQVFTVVDGLPSNYISSVVFDDNGRLYLLASRGLVISDDFMQSKTVYKDDGSSSLPIGSMRPKEGEADEHKFNMTVVDNLVYLPRVGSNGYMVFNLDDASVKEYLNGNSAYNIAVSGSNIAVATQNGLFLSKDSGSSFDNVLSFSGSPWGSTENSYEVVFGSNMLYFASRFMNDGVHSYNLDTGAFTVYTTPTLVSNKVQELDYKDSKLYVATDKGISIRDSAGTWSSITTANGLPSNDVYELYIDGDKIVAMMKRAGAAVSTDGGASWPTRYNNSNTPAGIVALDLSVKDGGEIYLGSVTGGMSRSLDDGLNWAKYLSGAINAVYAYGDNKLYAATDNEMYYSSDNGASWESVRFDIAEYSYDDDHPAVWGFYAEGDLLYAGAYDAVGVFNMATNTVEEVINVADLVSFPYVTAVTASGNMVFAGIAGYGLYVNEDKTVDDDAWTDFHDVDGTGPNCTLPSESIYNLSYDATRDNVYIGYARYDKYNSYGFTVLNNPKGGFNYPDPETDSCITYITDNAVRNEGESTPYQIDNGLGNDQVRATYIHSDGKVYVATYGGGVAVFNPDLRVFEKTYTTEDGLSSDYVSDVRIDEDTNTLYVYSIGGVSKMRLPS